MIYDRVSGGYLTQKKAYLLLISISRNYSGAYKDVFVSFDTNETCGSGSTSSVNPNNIMVGVKGLGKSNLIPVDEMKFMKALVAECHELRHHEQDFVLKYKGDYLSSSIALSKKAGNSNPHYYELNYSRNSSEYDAELNGLKVAYNQCKMYFGKEKADSLVCRYAYDKSCEKNDDLRLFPYKKRYDNVSSVFKDLEDGLLNSVVAHKKYDNVWHGNTHRDLIFRYFTIVPNRFDEFVNESNGMVQDAMCVAIEHSMYSVPEADYNVSAFEGLTTDVVFSDDFEKRSERPLPSVSDEIDNDMGYGLDII